MGLLIINASIVTCDDDRSVLTEARSPLMAIESRLLVPSTTSSGPIPLSSV
jgi:hypothetical protein